VKVTELKPQYVELMPKILEDGVLYISQKYATAVHKCCCGCGEKVVTPLKPTEWSLSVTKGAVTLYPSIGNWSLGCRSHYWIRDNRVVWAGNMANVEIERNRRRDRRAKQEYFAQVNAQRNQVQNSTEKRFPYVWARFLNWFTSR
jgi:hypothetical protein